MPKFRIGRHISTSYDLLTSATYAKKLGCNIFQIFLGVPQQVISKKKTDMELKKLGMELKKNKIKMVIHGSYTINLCHPPGNKQYKASVRALIQDLNASAVIGKRVYGVIIHMGKNIPANNISDEQALKNYITGLKEALSQTPDNTIIILETGASQGSEIGSKIESLAKIYGGLKENEKKRIKFCIDTCHIFASGYDITTSDGVKSFFKLFDDLIGVDKIVCIHFNDSKTPVNAHVDRHADIGYGFIKEPGLKEVTRFAQKNTIPIIFETPLDAVNMKTNKSVTWEEELGKVKSWLKS